MEWIPALSTTSLLAGALWLLRKVIVTRLTNAVRYEYEKDLEALRTSLRKNEETFKADLKEKEAQIEALRSGALTAILTRRTSLYARQLQAVEELWNSVIALAPAKGVSSTIAVLKFEEAAKESARNPRFREVFDAIGGNLDNNLGYQTATKSRPFVTELAWAYYSAYQAIIAHGVLKLKTLQLGLEKDFSDHKSIIDTVKVALPEYSDFIDEHGTSCLHYLLDALESKLLKEIQVMLKDKKADAEDIERAAQILKEAEKLTEENENLKQA